ncbi:MAG: hypothetical protein OIF47_15180 [Marinibacterium sp.]|nr:hypothetical protein [Marinibacterium sp.]
MKKKAVLASIIVSVALPASAQDISWRLVDTGVLSHPAHGEGIEMRIQPDPVPDGLFRSDTLDDLMLMLCNHFAPYAIPFVQTKMGIEDPDFIAVRIVSESRVGRYVLETYAISDGRCGGTL